MPKLSELLEAAAPDRPYRYGSVEVWREATTYPLPELRPDEIGPEWEHVGGCRVVYASDASWEAATQWVWERLLTSAFTIESLSPERGIIHAFERKPTHN